MTLFKHITGLLVIISLSIACSQPERITVEEDPEAAATGDTTEEAQTQATFQQINIGELTQIRTLDPLFADNAATMRAVQLIYEGLVRFDEEGELSPGLAYNWSVSEDSMRYEFNLRPEIYYHDSQVFSTGTGRRVVAEDIEFVFERMASLNVPPQAAQLFMSIEGFEPYYQEQRHVYNPQLRQVPAISGIETPDDSTVVFQLKREDSNFPEKLATPFASVYPSEAVTGSSSISPVGAGPFTFTQVTEDSTLILSKFQDYYGADDIRINRVDIRVDSSETALGKAMEAGELHILPQLGPQLLVNMIDENEQLFSEYEGEYELHLPGGSTTYMLRHYPESDLPESSARNIISHLDQGTDSYFEQFPGSLVRTDSIPSMQEDTLPQQQEIFTTFTEDPYMRTFLGSLSTGLAEQGASFQMMNIRAPTPQTSILFSTEYPLLPDSQWGNMSELFRFSVEHAALQQADIEGLNFNQYPWWFDLREASLSQTAAN